MIVVYPVSIEKVYSMLVGTLRTLKCVGNLKNIINSVKRTQNCVRFKKKNLRVI